MDTLGVVIIVVALALPLGLVIALVDIIRRPDAEFRAAQQSKTAAILIVLLTGGIGGYAWLFWLRHRLG